MNVFGVDIARSGDDRSIVYIRNGPLFVYMEEWAKADTMESAGRIERLYNRFGAEALIIDCDGVGAGVFDRLRELNLPVFAFHGSSRCDRRDRTGELGFRNLRSFAWWNVRELLEPVHGKSIEIPNDSDLHEELVVTKYHIRSGSLIEAQSKDEIKKRLGRSPDKGDAVTYAYSGIHLSTYETSYIALSGIDFSRDQGPRKDKTPAVEDIMTEQEQEEFMFRGATKRNCDLFDLADF